ncbi:MAG TPA: heme-binding protein [Acidimicrobiales bacterium]|nr:heme-binding protein [Acidimicrobiales bacterium]
MLGEERARALLAAALAAAGERGLAVSIAVVDDGGYLLGLVRMDGAHKLTPQMAIDKAYTAAIYRRPTAAMTAMPPELLAAARHAGLYDVLVMPGGVPVLEGELVVGGIGVAGAAPEADAECAEIGAAAP